VTIGSRAVADAIDDALDALQGPAAAAERSAAGGEQEWRPGSGVPLSDATMHFDLGIAYREMGVLDRAIEEFRRAGQDPGREANCQALIGACLVTMGKPKEAVEELKRGLHARHKGDVDELDLYYELANAHLALNDAKEALFYLQAIKRKDPGYRDVARRITALMSASRPGRRPSRPPRASEPPPAAPEDESAIDDAFDDLFKGGRN
jgi:tetratricopeptide (TPR) repeat protein